MQNILVIAVMDFSIAQTMAYVIGLVSPQRRIAAWIVRREFLKYSSSTSSISDAMLWYFFSRARRLINAIAILTKVNLDLRIKALYRAL